MEIDSHQVILKRRCFAIMLSKNKKIKYLLIFILEFLIFGIFSCCINSYALNLNFSRGFNSVIHFENQEFIEYALFLLPVVLYFVLIAFTLYLYWKKVRKKVLDLLLLILSSIILILIPWKLLLFYLSLNLIS